MMRGYWAAENYTAELQTELVRAGAHISEIHGRLILAENGPAHAAWAHNVWHEPVRLQVKSIGDAAKKLRELGGLWALASTHHHRRAELVQEQVPQAPRRLMKPYAQLPRRNPGAWTMLRHDEILVSNSCSHPFANGEIQFEPSSDPPSRAYTKLWELFTVYDCKPDLKENHFCLDLGASPGGWTWALADLGCSTIAVDKAELAHSVTARENVQVLKRDAFSLQPHEVGNVEWLFSDIICDPKRLFSLVTDWINAGAAQNFVCTLKFKGETDFQAIEMFRSINGSRLQHLNANKHELTWWKPADHQHPVISASTVE
jgi:23S rRNA (cytidine2498-2'-O)-methyltransferase